VANAPFPTFLMFVKMRLLLRQSPPTGFFPVLAARLLLVLRALPGGLEEEGICLPEGVPPPTSNYLISMS